MSADIQAQLLDIQRRLQYLETLEAGVTDYFTSVARGLVTGQTAVNKFGNAPDAIQTTLTDIWARAATQQIWLAPTAARQHNIVSASASDDGSPVGVGARTVTIYGLTSWSAAEVSETVTMNGTTNVLTSNSYVVIHRMQVATFGTSGPNVGLITATAVTDGTITAIISAGTGKTQLSVYGIPSTQALYINDFHFSINKSAGSPTVTFQLRVNPDPGTTPTVFITKHLFGHSTTATSADDWMFKPPLKIAGPAIVKISAIASAANTDGSAHFNGVLIDN